MTAGFSRVDITPPIGTRFTGLGTRDLMSGAQSIHDPLYVRALYCEHEGEAVFILSFDLCFVGRGDADRFKGAIGRRFGLSPANILLSATHNHAGPAIGTWYWSNYKEPERVYEQQLERAILQACEEALQSSRPATLRAGETKSTLPVSRRKVIDGIAHSLPDYEALVYDALPLALFEDAEDKRPICLLFSIATHPSLMRKWEISADYCGVACDLIDEHLGATASLFLQGTGGDSKPRTIARGEEWEWHSDWSETEETGRILAHEAIEGLQRLKPVEPKVHGAITETQWPLQTVERSYLEAVKADASVHGDLQIASLWAARQLEEWDTSGHARATAPVLMQGIQLGEGLRLIAFEGEPVAFYGHMMREKFADGITFPLGYANGEALYLVTSPMLDEGAMEVTSYYEYGFPAPLAKGMEDIAAAGIDELCRQGIN